MMSLPPHKNEAGAGNWHQYSTSHEVHPHPHPHPAAPGTRRTFTPQQRLRPPMNHSGASAASLNPYMDGGAILWRHASSLSPLDTSQQHDLSPGSQLSEFDFYQDRIPYGPLTADDDVPVQLPRSEPQNVRVKLEDDDDRYERLSTIEHIKAGPGSQLCSSIQYSSTVADPRSFTSLHGYTIRPRPSSSGNPRSSDYGKVPSTYLAPDVPGNVNATEEETTRINPKRSRGVSPTAMSHKNESSHHPSPNDLAEDRVLAEKNINVKNWLEQSERERSESVFNPHETLQSPPIPSQELKDSVSSRTLNLGAGVHRPRLRNFDLRTFEIPKAQEPDSDVEETQEKDSDGCDIGGDDKNNEDGNDFERWTSTKGMEIYNRQIKKFDALSRIATFGSRCRSLDSLRAELNTARAPDPNSLWRNPFHRHSHKTEHRHLSLSKMLRDRSSSHSNLKRKEVSVNEQLTSPPAFFELATSDNRPSPHPIQSSSADPHTPTSPTNPSSFRTSVSNVLRRTRSKGEHGNTFGLRRSRSRGEQGSSQGLAGEWRKLGGPPVANLKSPSQQQEDTRPLAIENYSSSRQKSSDDEGDDLDEDNALPNLALEGNSHTLPMPSSATKEAFKTHIQQACKSIEPYLLERMTEEQWKRYTRLVANRRDHGHRCDASVVATENGFADDRQNSTNRGVTQPSSRENGRQYRVGRDRSAEGDGIPSAQLAEFPRGIPLPPVSRLPCKFECPWCFTHLSKIKKPSDWTKHVLEDVRAFTCTFPGCTATESTAFKRKADWVRHEKELHRRLEWWACRHSNCQYQCYREENFIQHLSRQHGYQEGPIQTSKLALNGASMSRNDANEASRQAEKCHHTRPPNPMDDICRFCGACFPDWKQLSGHLAQHMMYISLPILALIEQLEQDGQGPVALHKPKQRLDVRRVNRGERTDMDEENSDESLSLHNNYLQNLGNDQTGSGGGGMSTMNTGVMRDRSGGPPRQVTPDTPAENASTSLTDVQPDVSNLSNQSRSPYLGSYSFRAESMSAARNPHFTPVEDAEWTPDPEILLQFEAENNLGLTHVQSDPTHYNAPNNLSSASYLHPMIPTTRPHPSISGSVFTTSPPLASPPANTTQATGDFVLYSPTGIYDPATVPLPGDDYMWQSNGQQLSMYQPDLSQSPGQLPNNGFWKPYGNGQQVFFPGVTEEQSRLFAYQQRVARMQRNSNNLPYHLLPQQPPHGSR